MNLTALIACKDRPKNIAFCLASINTCKPRPLTIVIDFGSEIPLSFPQYSKWLKIIRIDRKTAFFHKARALNIGLRAVKTKFCCITDADQIFQTNFFGVVYKVLLRSPKNFVMCYTYWLKNIPNSILPENVRENYPALLKITKRGEKPHGDGCCNGFLTSWGKKVRGYDENYVGYGGEDSDFALRAVLGGLNKCWVHHATNMIHLPHPKKGQYYKALKTNKKRYKKKLITKQIIANINIKWGAT